MVKKSLVMLVASLAVGMIFASVSIADTTPQMPTPTTTTTLQAGSSTFNVNDVLSGKVTFLSYIKAHGLTKAEIKAGNKQLHKHGCFDATYPMWNSGLTIYDHFAHRPSINQVDWYRDPWPGTVCWVSFKVSPTGLARKACGNFMMFMHQKPPASRIVRGRVVLVRSAAKLKLKVTVEKVVSGSVSCVSNGVSASAYLSNSASSSLYLSLAVLVKSKGAVTAGLQGQVEYKLQIWFDNKISVMCQGSPQPPPQVCQDQSALNFGGSLPCQYGSQSTPPPSVSVVSYTSLNQVPAGMTSGPAPFTVIASDAGSVTVNPGIGTVSDCNGGAAQSSITFQLSAGSNQECVIYYAPMDASQPTSDTLTYTAIVTTPGGTAKDVKVDQFAITYPQIP